MGYWGWRRLLVFFLSVWVTGCTTTNDNALNIPPTNYPPVTLTVRSLQDTTPVFTAQEYKAPTFLPARTTIVYTARVGDRWETVAQRFGVDRAALQSANPTIGDTPLLPGQRITIISPVFTQDGRPVLPTATPPDLSVPPPNCSATPTGTVICYGLVENTLPIILEQVTVRLYLFDNTGEILAEGETGLEQPFLLPGMPAPYHIQLAADWNDYAGAQAVIVSASEAENANKQVVPLSTETQAIQAVSEMRYRVRAALVNPEIWPVSAVRVIIILYDEAQRIASYRVLEIPGSLAAQAVLPVEVDVFLPDGTAPVTTMVYALGLRTTPD